MIDDSGNIVVLTVDGISSYDPTGALRWFFPLPFSFVYTSLALGQKGQVIVKSGDDWYALDANGKILWSRVTSLIGAGIVIVVDGPHNSASPAMIAPDGSIRSVNTEDGTEIRSAETGDVIGYDVRSADSSYRNSSLLGLGPSAENLVLAPRQPPQLDPAVPYLETPSAGNFRVRWTMSAGTGQAWSNAIALGDGSYGPPAEHAIDGLCAPSGEVLVSTTLGTIIMPHDGIGSRRWNETAFAVGQNNEVLCYDGTHLVLRRADHTVAWSLAAEGTHFALASDGRVYGGTSSLSSYDTGVLPAAGPWAQPRGDAMQRARAAVPFGPFTPSIASIIDAPASQTLYDSYAGQVTASPYVQGPGTVTWEKDDVSVGAAADDYSFVVRSASSETSGTYRLRIDAQQGVVRSPPIAVTVAAPTPIKAGLYWGKLRPPDNALYCLEIKSDRTVRYLTSDGEHFTPAMNVRLNPLGGYPWALHISQYNQNVALRADASGVAVSWQDGPFESATVAAATLPNGARTGWYDGNYVGPLSDDCVTELALLPDATLIGRMSRASGGTFQPRQLDPNALTQQIGPGEPFGQQLTIILNAAGRIRFEYRSYPYSRSVPEVYEAFTPGAAPDTRLINLSVGSRVGGDAGTIIAGIVAAAPGQYLIRGVGPALATFGVPAPYAVPGLKLTHPAAI